MKHLVLLGGGHAHLFVLERLAQDAAAGRQSCTATLVSPCRWHYYSGMLPGWIAGHYALSQCRIDLARLCLEAGVQFVEAQAISLDIGRQIIATDSATAPGTETAEVHYDLLSLNTGSVTARAGLQGLGPALLPIKPLHEFVVRWPLIPADGPIAVAGGGAAGVELSLAIRYRTGRKVVLLSGQGGVLAEQEARLRGRALRELRAAGVQVVQADAAAVNGELRAGRMPVPAACVVAVTGPSAPEWLRGSGLALDPAGYVLVDANHRSSASDVYAAGDICARIDTPMARSGVHAVKAGPVLADNLLASLGDQDLSSLRQYRPRRRVLYLLSCGRRHALASWGRLSTEGRWVWHWKDRIDRGFISRFTIDKEAGSNAGNDAGIHDPAREDPP